MTTTWVFDIGAFNDNQRADLNRLCGLLEDLVPDLSASWASVKIDTCELTLELERECYDTAPETDRSDGDGR